MIFRRKNQRVSFEPELTEPLEEPRQAESRQVRADHASSIIGQDVVIEGHVTAAGELHIDGSIFGTVTAHSCVVDVNGFVQGEIRADDVFIRGRVIGPISGKNISIYQGAEVEGDIFNETISIENGASLFGLVSHTTYQVATSTQAPAPLAPSPQAEVVSLFATSLRSEQDNNSYLEEDNAYRPIKVVKPR